MGPHVGQEVVEDLPQPASVARDQHRAFRLDVQRPFGSDRPGGRDGVHRHLDQINVRAFDRAALVQAGEQQQVLDQMAHPGRLAADPAHDPGQILRPALGAALEQLGVRRDGGDRGAQFVRGVRHEPPQAALGLAERRLGGVACREGALDAAQHDVEGPGQTAHLGLAVLSGHPLVELAVGDGPGGPLDVAQRAQAETHQPPADQPGQDHGATRRRPAR